MRALLLPIKDLRHAKQRRVPLAHDPCERSLVAGPQGSDELGIVLIHATNVAQASA